MSMGRVVVNVLEARGDWVQVTVSKGRVVVNVLEARGD